MTVILILCTMLLFLAADYFIQRSPRQAGSRVASVPISAGHTALPPIGIAINHTWVSRGQDGVATVGIDHFLGGLLGVVQSIALPREGECVSSVAEDIVLSEGEKSLSLGTPVSGRVVAVNADVIRDPGLVRKDPYGDGWLFRVDTNFRELQTPPVFEGAFAVQWIKKQSELVRDFLASRGPGLQPATLQDGGLPVEGILKKYDGAVWKEFHRAFTSLRPDREF